MRPCRVYSWGNNLQITTPKVEIYVVRHARRNFFWCILMCLLTFYLWPISSSAQGTTGLVLGEETGTGQGTSTLDLGPAGNNGAGKQPNGEGIQGAQDLIRTTYGAWEVACAQAGAPCVMAQIGNDKAGTPMLEMVLRKLPEPQTVQGVPVIAVTDIITPLGVVLTSGVSMKIDSGNEQRAPFQICTEQGCLVREPLTEEAITRFKRGASTLLTIVAAQQGPIEVNLSLTGFTRAYNALK